LWRIYSGVLKAHWRACLLACRLAGSTLLPAALHSLPSSSIVISDEKTKDRANQGYRQTPRYRQATMAAVNPNTTFNVVPLPVMDQTSVDPDTNTSSYFTTLRVTCRQKTKQTLHSLNKIFIFGRIVRIVQPPPFPTHELTTPPASNTLHRPLPRNGYRRPDSPSL
jgi:hypothetical protein